MSAEVGTARIDNTFAALKKEGRKALIIYLMAGDPDPSFTVELVPKLAGAGADIVELGFPFSDPIADGPVIQAAAERALPHLAALPDCLKLVGRIRAATETPLVSMTYYNPIFRYGERRFFNDGLAAGLDGLIIPDLPLVEAGEWRALCEEVGLASIFLEAPTSDNDSARAIAEASRGFVYMISLKGVTGADRGIGENLAERVERMRGFTQTPTAVGFGISTPEQAATFGAMCDGVIVGSGVVSRIAEGKNHGDAERRVLDYVSEMRAGLDKGP